MCMFPISKCISHLIEFCMGYFVLSFYYILSMCMCAHVRVSMEAKGQPLRAFFQNCLKIITGSSATGFPGNLNPSGHM